jgi:hypothetical protein
MVAEGKLDRTQTAVLKALLSFLNAGFPDLPAGKALCVGISIEWEKEGPSQRTLRPKFPEEDYPRLALRVVPDLRSPGKVDAHDWVDQVNSLKPGGLSLAAGDILLQMVRGFFGAAESMPMRDLNQKFESLIP